MSYSATVYNVLIASPSDVENERRIARDVIHEWNTVHSESQCSVLMPLGWESHSFPQMGSRPQEVINSQVLQRCDFLVAIFWTRLGSPTGEASSGTVEEIEDDTELFKQFMDNDSFRKWMTDTVFGITYGGRSFA